MVEKIENLAQASEDSSSETVSGLVKKKRVKEQELRKTLEQLELVASQIEEAADTADSIEEVDTIEKIAKLLQSISITGLSTMHSITQVRKSSFDSLVDILILKSFICCLIAFHMYFPV